MSFWFSTAILDFGSFVNLNLVFCLKMKLLKDWKMFVMQFFENLTAKSHHLGSRRHFELLWKKFDHYLFVFKGQKKLNFRAKTSFHSLLKYLCHLGFP
jgi:hypothetical protein